MQQYLATHTAHYVVLKPNELALGCSPMESGTKHRLLLSLRAERAMGLKAIPRPKRAIIVDEPAVEPAKRAAPVEAVRRPTAPNPAPVPKVAPVATKPAAAKTLPLVMADSGPFTSAVLSTDAKRAALAAMDADEVRGCKLCELHKGRTHTVFGEGDPGAGVFFIGEGPGADEDATGRPFVGRSGQLLDKMLASVGLKREKVFIANIVKCRPPGNRVPATVEVDTCTPYLLRQLEIVRPKIIVSLGRPAAIFMLGNPRMTMGSVRGQWQTWRGIALMPTYHPSYVLRTYTEAVRKAVWDDLKEVVKKQEELRVVSCELRERGENAV